MFSWKWGVYPLCSSAKGAHREVVFFHAVDNTIFPMHEKRKKDPSMLLTLNVRRPEASE